jgi:hypothetical protein
MVRRGRGGRNEERPQDPSLLLSRGCHACYPRMHAQDLTLLKVALAMCGTLRSFFVTTTDTIMPGLLVTDTWAPLPRFLRGLLCHRGLLFHASPNLRLLARAISHPGENGITWPFTRPAATGSSSPPTSRTRWRSGISSAGE